MADPLPLLIDVSFKSLLAAGVTALVLGAARVRDPALRHAAWTAVLGLSLVVAPLAWLLPSRTLPLLPGAVPALPAAPVASHDATAMTAPGSAWSWIWIGGAALMLARLAVGFALRRRWLASASDVRDARATAELDAICRRARLRRRPRMLACRGLSVPVVGGLARPTILLPLRFRRWTIARLRCVLAHELAHVARGDLWVQTAAALYRALFWFHPLAWFLERRLRRLAELSADELAASWTGSRRRYAHHLLDVAAAARGAGPFKIGGLAMAERHSLRNRIHALIEGARPSAPWRRAVVVAVLALVIVGAGAVKIGAEEPPPEPPPPPAAEPAPEPASEPLPGAAPELAGAPRALPAAPAAPDVLPEPALAPLPPAAPEPATRSSTVAPALAPAPAAAPKIAAPPQATPKAKQKHKPPKEKTKTKESKGKKNDDARSR